MTEVLQRFGIYDILRFLEKGLFGDLFIRLGVSNATTCANQYDQPIRSSHFILRGDHSVAGITVLCANVQVQSPKSKPI